MYVTTDIFAAYTAPRRVMARQLGQGIGEERGLAYVMIGCLLYFVSQLPEVARRAHLEGIDLTNQAFNQFIGAVFLLPLLLYGVAALSHLIARSFGGQGTWLRARIALFWAVLAAVPAMLLRGLIAGFIGPGLVYDIASWGALLVLLHIWIGSLVAAETPEAADV